MTKNSLTRCPHCEQPLMLVARPPIHPSQRGWQQIPVVQSTASGNHPPLSGITTGDWEKITPLGRLEPRDVTTALYDAGVVGVMGLVVSAVGIVLVNVYVDGWHIHWWASPLTGLAAFCWRYLGGMSLAKSLLEIVESITGQDDQAEPVQVPEPPQPQTVRVEMQIQDSHGKRWQFADLGVEASKLIALAKACLAGESFSERTATAIGLTQEKFGDLRDSFISRGWAMWNHPTRRQQGCSLTHPGKSVLRAIAATPSPNGSVAHENGVHGRTQQHAAQNFQFIKE